MKAVRKEKSVADVMVAMMEALSVDVKVEHLESVTVDKSGYIAAASMARPWEKSTGPLKEWHWDYQKEYWKVEMTDSLWVSRMVGHWGLGDYSLVAESVAW